jgi:hypothetical protein
MEVEYPLLHLVGLVLQVQRLDVELGGLLLGLWEVLEMRRWLWWREFACHGLFLRGEMDFDSIVWIASLPLILVIGWIVRTTTWGCQTVSCSQSSSFACWVLSLPHFLLVHILVAPLLTALSAAILSAIACAIHATRTCAVDATVLGHDEVLIHYIGSVISGARLEVVILGDSVCVEIGDVLSIILQNQIWCEAAACLASLWLL